MKKVLGLDLGTNSIGWALVNEAENKNEKSDIVKLGVRIIQYDNFSKIDKSGKVSESKSPIDDFASGSSLSPNASRTQKRGTRRNLQRFKLRRKTLRETLISNNIITTKTILAEAGKGTTYKTLEKRAKAAKGKIELEEFAKVLFAINKKRGYKSNRKASNDGEGAIIDGMSIAKELYDNNLTPGELIYNRLIEGKKYIPDFYPSDLRAEFDSIWKVQKQFYPEALTDELYKMLKNKNKTQTWAICKDPFSLVGIKQIGKADEKKLERYGWRVKGLEKQLELEHLAIVLQEINNNIKGTSGYLGEISDRSKELYFKKETVGENLYKQIQANRHTSLKRQVFYRQDYMDEFETIWNVQAKYYPILTINLKEEIRDIIIFYQRKLKSQKGLLSFCQFESWDETYYDNKKGKNKKRRVGQKVIPKSSPLFQEFKIWQNINNIEIIPKKDEFINSSNQVPINKYKLEDEDRKILFEELNLRGNLKMSEVFKLLKINASKWKANFNEIEGNRTNQVLFNVYYAILENEGYGFDWSSKRAMDILNEVKSIFSLMGIDDKILEFNSKLSGDEADVLPSYQFWHLLYSATEDEKMTSEEDQMLYGNSNVSLKKVLNKKYGFKAEYAKLVAGISFTNDHGSLSARAIRKILPFLVEGHEYSEACCLAGYNHSNFMKKEENERRKLLSKLILVEKNSLRNPVVEKILNQMVNTVNQLIDEYGKPDEVRIELARELKKSAKEREEMTKYIVSATKANEDIRKIITKEHGIPNPTKNDVIRYKLYLELKANGFRSIFTNQYIPKEKIFSKEIDIEHIIPKALLFDDSFSNKTLAFRDVNQKKDKKTGFDFIEKEYNSDLSEYKARVEMLYDKGKGNISKGKYHKLLMSEANLPEGFILRSLRNSQYIAKKAKSMLEDVFKTVIPTSGRITDKLRSDWDLINVMKELNMPKYEAAGMTEFEERRNNKKHKVIKNWSKRNDHRHHAMDALTVSFTSHNHIHYLNNLNTITHLKGEQHDLEKSKLSALKLSITKVYNIGSSSQKRKFIPPMPNFRTKAKKQLENILISFKARNKVVTRNINKIKTKSSIIEKVQLTPRGQLHKETIYGRIKEPKKTPVKLNRNFDLAKARLIIDKHLRILIVDRLKEYDNSPENAFNSKALKASPLIYKNQEITHVRIFKNTYTIRKEINPDNFKNKESLEKIIDHQIRAILIKRLDTFGGKAKEAFSDLAKNPIWLNKNQSISIKRVKISGMTNVEALHSKKDFLGNDILDVDGEKIPNDFVSPGNNHHVAIYIDGLGKLQEKVVSYYEAVARINSDLLAVDKEFNIDKEWRFLFTIKKNEMFVFPNKETGFDPSEIDLLDDDNNKIISPNLFRVQAISTKDYKFRHHLESTVVGKIEDVLFKRIRSPKGLIEVKKVRINHIGKIVQVF